MSDASSLSPFIIEPLGRDHDRTAFCCGNDALDRYLKQQARQDARRNVTALFVMVERGSKLIKGYYTLSMTGIELENLPDDLIRMMPKYPMVPAALLGRLAADQSCHGRGLGKVLLADALKRCLHSEIAWTAIVVDAIDHQAAAFYEHHGFIRFPGLPRKLFILRKTVELGAAGNI